MKRFFDLCSSLRLTLVLLLGLSLVAIGGTIWPVEQGNIQRFELYYQSLWFRLLLSLFALNLAACTWKTFRRVNSEKQRLLEQLAKLTASTVTPQLLPGIEVGEVASRLKQHGYHVSQCGDRLLARRGRSGRWALPIMHLAILAVMLGALAAQLGFVGTMNLYVTHQSDRYFDWAIEGEQPLDFTFRLDHFEPQYYPIDLRFSTYDKNSRELLQEFTSIEGDTVEISPGLSVQVLRFFPEEQHLVLGVVREGVPIGEYHSLSGDRSYPNSIDLGIEIKPTAFRDPLLKQLHSEVTILEHGEVVRQGIIEVNHPLVHRGVAIYQTAYSRDESGFWTCGFQLSKDPGEPLVWVGSIVLSLALILVFVVRLRALGLVLEPDGWRVVPMVGFRSEVGAKQLETLLAALNKGLPAEQVADSRLDR